MLEPVLAGTLAVVGAAGVWWLARAGGPYRSGPWPGLTWRGAALLLAHALLLAAGQVALGRPQQPMPDLVLLAVLSLAPLALATRLVQAPGVASAVCGAFLLPRALANLLNPTLELAPLLLVPALVFDVATWLRASDLAGLRDLLPRRRRVWRRRVRSPRRLAPFARGDRRCELWRGPGDRRSRLFRVPRRLAVGLESSCSWPGGGAGGGNVWRAWRGAEANAIDTAGRPTGPPTPPPPATVVDRETAAPRARRPRRHAAPGTDSGTART